ncbi:asparagine synthase (glutamine-hydrolyzing) [Bradyrhizobium sp. AUGA SZCCT0222]|uniref:asparagine synthase (glutamine-hydrolyzing) n=1 Tax=Bradyrhizobium sp. AUGA SZCCT0222 TaxID=2807668 RepID=UPI001BAE05E7|nr:asparagine synthase (glutamine-hydrolyzing) [Bradyrhizobium sp. AUGA SZCCT0222]MBR1270657.1 asparagine synthase (glutamine-hydrolyzing) [Bradyrhizobium sp. AUGA SZCCT0222]
MCGVFGWILFNRDLTDYDIEQSRQATKLLAHRGPEFQGETISPRVYLGHRRLSILDLSASANQPFSKNGGGEVLSFNGEIYNFIELREELSGYGHRFTTTSDTEVMLAAFKQWGVDALLRFDGMFAGGLHDLENRRQIIFRDPLGQKPLYYYADDDCLIYASELRSLLSLKSFSWQIDKGAFARFLANSYYAWTDTPVAGVKKLPPGCFLEIEKKAGQPKRYWTSTPKEPIEPLSESDAIDQLDEILTASCVQSMRSDVPYGVFLSGGLDSSIVLDACARSNAEVQSFSVRMSEADFDESAKANAVAKHIGIKNHHVFTLNQSSVIDALDHVLENIDEPHGDPGLVNTHFLAQSVRTHITVGIAGDGGDELFAGYAPFQGLQVARLLRLAPAAFFPAAQSVLGFLPGSDSYLGLQFKAAAFLQGFPSDDWNRLPLWLATVPPEDLKRLMPGIPPAFFSRQANDESLLGLFQPLEKSVTNEGDTNKCLHFYQQVFLPEFVCMHTDRGAMLNSLEVRSPLLSRDMIKFANTLPSSMKVSGIQTKVLLRKLARRRGLPNEIVNQSKQGFTFPIARWLKGALKSRLDALLKHPLWQEDGLVDMSVVEHYYSQHMAGRRNYYRLLYNLAVFAAWRLRFPQVSR